MDASEFVNPAHELMADNRTGTVVGVTLLCKITGYSANAIQKDIKAGAPLAVRGGPGKEHKLDTAKFITYLVRKERNRLMNLFMQRTAQGDGKYEKGNFKARRAAAQAELAEIEVMEKRGKLVPIDLVTTVLQRLIGNARAHLLVIPTKAASEVATVKDPETIRNYLENLIHESLNELAAISADDLVSQNVLESLEAPAEVDGEPVGRSVPKAKPRGKRASRTVANKPRAVPA